MKDIHYLNQYWNNEVAASIYLTDWTLSSGKECLAVLTTPSGRPVKCGVIGSKSIAKSDSPLNISPIRATKRRQMLLTLVSNYRRWLPITRPPLNQQNRTAVRSGSHCLRLTTHQRKISICYNRPDSLLLKLLDGQVKLCRTGNASFQVNEFHSVLRCFEFGA